MYCPKCGAKNDDGATRCASCLELLPAMEGQSAPPPQDVPPYQQAQQTPPPGGTPPYQQTPPPQQPYAPPPYNPNAQYQEPGYGQYGQPQPLPTKPSTFLAGNIILTVLSLCGCVSLIPGIIGIVFSAMVGSRYTSGDYDGARNASKVAKIMFFVTLGLLIVTTIVMIAYLALGLSVGLGEFMDALDYYMY